METNIAWWGGLYIIATFGFMYFMWTGKNDDDYTGRWGIVWAARDIICYLALIAITILYFQTLDNQILQNLFLGLSAYILLVCSYYVYDCIKEFAKDPHGVQAAKEEGEDEPVGIVINSIAYSITAAFYGCGIAIAVIGSQALLP